LNFLSVKFAYLFTITSMERSPAIFCWLVTIPIVITLQLVSTIILTAANLVDTQKNSLADAQSSELRSHGLIPGSKADERAMLKVLAVASYTYSWMLFFLIAIPLGVAWFVLRRDLKAQKSSNPSIISA
jgi:hypothetical protein